jgi:N-acetylglucosamine repressor
VHLENSGKACALAQLWSTRNHGGNPPSLVFVNVSDGLGVGVVVHGELLRGQHNIAGEFGHMPISIDGPRCGCGRSGCWQAYVSNLATLSRYFGRDLRQLAPDPRDVLPLTMDDLITRAQAGGQGDRGGAGDRALPGPRPRRARQRGRPRGDLPER